MLLTLLASSAWLNGNVEASTPKPSVPQFTLKLVDASFPGSTTYSIDPYTGENKTFEQPAMYGLEMYVTIKNQPYPATINGNASEFHYHVQVKGHFGGSWEEPIVEKISPQTAPLDGSGYTVIAVQVGQYGDRAQLDVQVEALLGYNYQYLYSVPDHILVLPMNDRVSVSSGWSDTQTVTLPEPTWPNSASATPSPTPQATTNGSPLAEATQNAQEINQSSSDQEVNNTLLIAVTLFVLALVVLSLFFVFSKKYRIVRLA